MHGTFRRVAAVATACVAAGSVTLIASPPASAAGGWVITPGGVIDAVARPWQPTDVTTGGRLVSCTSLDLHGQLGSGTVPGPSVGQFGSATVSCSGGTSPFSVTPQGFPWPISATGYDQVSGTVAGSIGGFVLHPAGAGCTFDIRGTSPTSANVSFGYRNATHALTIGSAGDLHAWNVSGLCLGLVNNGDSVGSQTFDVEPPQTIVPAA
jgi:hypothetical protein